MGKHKRSVVILLAAVMSFMMLLPACSGGRSSADGMQQNVTVGKRCFVDKSGVVFYGYKNLICTAVMKDGEITEFIPEGGTTGTIYAMAVYSDYLYISASDGFFRYPLSMFSDGEGGGSAETVMSDHLEEYNHFEIFDDRLFFLDGRTLRYVPVGGGEPVDVRSGIYDFEVSDRGIYAAEENGNLLVISPDLTESRQIGVTAERARMTSGGMDLYYRDEGAVKAFSVEKEESADVGNTSEAYQYYVPWSNGENVMYSDDDFICRLVTPEGDKEMGKCFAYPGKAEGYVYGDWLISIEGSSTFMWVFDLAKGEMKSYDLEAEMKEYLDTINGGGGGSDPEPAPKTGDDYDITKGMAMEASEDGSEVYFFFNDFLVVMPNERYLGHLEDKDSVTFFHTGAERDGYGGKLVTLKAYDPDDDSYRDLPSYRVAGVCRNTGKRIVAIYPTDLQYNSNDADQAAEYKVLYQYVQKIDEGSSGSPVRFADSD